MLKNYSSRLCGPLFSGPNIIQNADDIWYCSLTIAGTVSTVRGIRNVNEAGNFRVARHPTAMSIVTFYEVNPRCFFNLSCASRSSLQYAQFGSEPYGDPRSVGCLCCCAAGRDAMFPQIEPKLSKKKVSTNPHLRKHLCEFHIIQTPC
jgi:hypothetical protein